MRISFIGDVMLGRFVAKKYNQSNYSIVDKEIIDYCRKSNYVLANLESPIISSNERNHDHLVFEGYPEMLDQFKWINCFSLSNNHINDSGIAGMNETIEQLQQNGIDWNGLYKDEYKPLIIQNDSNKIAVITCTDMMNREFEEDNSWNTIRIGDELLDKLIVEYKKNGFYVILYAHVGMLFSRFPNPLIRQFAHEKIDNGVDLIVTVHPHVLGCTEIYKGKQIFYSLGDFVMDGSSFRRRLAGIVSIDIENNELKDWVLDITQTNMDLQTTFVSQSVQDKALKKFSRVSKKLDRNSNNYNGFFRRQYKIEMLQHSLSTVQFIFKTKGIRGLLRLLYIRSGAVKTMASRVVSDRSKMRYDNDAIKHDKKLFVDDIS